MLNQLNRTSGPAAVVLIRVLVGWVSLSEGIQKFLYSDAVGVGRFATIGIPSPEVMAPLVGVSRSRAARCSCWWSAAVVEG